MIYTIGKTEWYEQYFEEQEPPHPMKAVGGSVWETPYKARWFTYEKEIIESIFGKLTCQTLVNNGYSVYGVWADWKYDTINNGESWNELLIDAPLIKVRKEWGGTL